MKKDELIKILEKSLRDADLHTIVSSTMALIRRAESILITDDGDKASADRESVLDTYRLRQKRLSKTGAVVEGFDETVASLQKRQCSRINVINVTIGERLITLLIEPPGAVVGCFLGKLPSTALEI